MKADEVQEQNHRPSHGRRKRTERKPSTPAAEGGNSSTTRAYPSGRANADENRDIAL